MDSFYTSHRPTLPYPVARTSIRSAGPHIIRRAFHPEDATHTSATRAMWLVIGINAVSFGAWQYATVNKDRRLTQWLFDNTLVSQAAVQAGRWWTAVTSAFSHINLTHFAFNMLSLHAFCSLLSFIPGVGGGHIVALVLGSAVSGSVYFLVRQQQRSPTPRNNPNASGAALGASGVVMGCAAAATCLIPTAPMNLMFIPIPIPLWLLTVVYAGVDLFYLDAQDSRIAHAGHLGGTMFGLMYYAVFLRGIGGVAPMLRRALLSRL